MKKMLIMILLAIGIGGGIAYFLFTRQYVDDEVVRVHAFQVGVFSNYDNALRVADRNNGIVVKDNDLYRVYVSILSSDDAVLKMMKYYDSIGLKYYLRDINVSKEFLSSIKSSEELLMGSSCDTYKVINLSVLSKYEELL